MQYFQQHPALFLVAGIVLVVVTVFAARGFSYPYRKAGPLLTAAERNFFGTLDRIAAPRFRVFVKVRMGDLITVKSSGNRKKDIIALNRVAAKHIDFVLAHPMTFEPIVAIELDDSSHDRANRRRRDAFVNEAFKVCEIPLLRFKAKGRYDAIELVTAIDQALAPPEKK